MTEAALLQADAPFVHVLPGTPEQAYALTERLSSNIMLKVAARTLRGSKMTCAEKVFDEFAAALQFPPYFGYNFDALFDCLTDLAWIPADAYILVVWDAEVLWRKDPTAFEMTLRTLRDAAASWAGDAVPFHTVVQCAPEHEIDMLEQLNKSGPHRGGP